MLLCCTLPLCVLSILTVSVVLSWGAVVTRRRAVRSLRVWCRRNAVCCLRDLVSDFRLSRLGSCSWCISRGGAGGMGCGLGGTVISVRAFRLCRPPCCIRFSVGRIRRPTRSGGRSWAGVFFTCRWSCRVLLLRLAHAVRLAWGGECRRVYWGGSRRISFLRVYCVCLLS